MWYPLSKQELLHTGSCRAISVLNACTRYTQYQLDQNQQDNYIDVKIKDTVCMMSDVRSLIFGYFLFSILATRLL